MRVTKAILTGGGRATRLRPITNTINKHLIPLLNQPMIFYALKKVAAAGITEVFININEGETQLQQVVGDGSQFGISIKYFVQPGGPLGIAHVVNSAREFIGDDPFLFYLSDNIILGSITPLIEEFSKTAADCQLAFARVPDPERFGVPVFDGDRLVDIIEKPAKPLSNFAVTGIYLYGPKIFFEAFDAIKPSTRGEYEISDIHSYFLKTGKRVNYQEVTGWWKDTGKPEDLLLANKLLLEEQHPGEYQNLGQGEPIAEGKVAIGEGTTIGKGVFLLGPVMIGKNCQIEACALGPNVTIGDGAKILNHPVIDNTLVLPKAVINGPIHLTQSIIGESAQIKRANPANHHRFIIGDQTNIEIF